MNIYLFLFAVLISPAVSNAGPDCTGKADACAATPQKTSPFLQAARGEEPVVKAPANKAAAAPNAERLPSASPAAVSASEVSASAVSASAVSASDVQSEPGGLPGQSGKLSSPAWLLLVLLGFSGLYYYLRGGLKKRRRK